MRTHRALGPPQLGPLLLLEPEILLGLAAKRALVFRTNQWYVLVLYWQNLTLDYQCWVYFKWKVLGIILCGYSKGGIKIMCVMLTEEIITLKYKASYLTYKLARSFLTACR